MILGWFVKVSFQLHRSPTSQTCSDRPKNERKLCMSYVMESSFELVKTV